MTFAPQALRHSRVGWNPVKVQDAVISMIGLMANFSFKHFIFNDFYFKSIVVTLKPAYHV